MQSYDSSFRGVSLRHLLTVTRGLPRQSTHAFLESFVRPVTLENRESYADMLLRTGKGNLVKDVADAFISHAWGDDVQATLESVNRGWQLCQSPSSNKRGSLSQRLSQSLRKRKSQKKQQDADDLYVFFDVVVVNQYSANTNPHEWWETVFRKAVETMGRTFLALNDWRRPRMLERCWCIYEIACSSKVIVCLEPAQEQELERTLLNEGEKFQDIISALSRVDAQTSQATKESDKEAIFASIRGSLGGFEKVNKLVLDELRSWLLSTAQASIKRHEVGERSRLDLERATGHLLLQLGRMSEAVEAYTKVLSESSKRSSISERDVAADKISLAASIFEERSSKDKLKKAESLFHEAFETLSSSSSSSSQVSSHMAKMCARCLNDLGLVERALGKDDEALETFAKAQKYAQQTDDARIKADCLLNHSECLTGLGRPDEALPGLLKVHKAYQKIYHGDHPATAQVENLMGQAYVANGEPAKAKPLFESSLRKRQKALGDNHAYVGFVLQNLLALENLDEKERQRYQDQKSLLKNLDQNKSSRFDPKTPNKPPRIQRELSVMSVMTLPLGKEDDFQPDRDDIGPAFPQRQLGRMEPVPPLRVRQPESPTEDDDSWMYSNIGRMEPIFMERQACGDEVQPDAVMNRDFGRSSKTAGGCSIL